MPAFTRDYKADFAAIERALQEREPFCFVRFNDGEFALLAGKPYKAASGWRLRRGSESWLRAPLLASLKARLPGYMIGISTDCCVPKAVTFYRREVMSPRSRVTFATLFFNCNYIRALKLFRDLDAVVITSGDGDFKVPGDGVTRKWDIDQLVDKLLEVKKPIFAAAGPASCVIGHRYWERALERQTVDRRFRPQPFVDVGATLDVVVHGQRTRLYHDAGSPMRGHVCGWTPGVRRTGLAPANTQPAGPQPQRHILQHQGYEQPYQTGPAPVSAQPRELDTAVRAAQAKTHGEHRREVKEHLRRQVGSGAWARRRVRKGR